MKTGKLTVLLIVMCMLLGACADRDRSGDLAELPCEVPAQSVNLGRPQTDRKPAEFTYDGEGTVYASLATLEPSEWLFETKGDFTGMFFGRTSQPPVYDARNGDIDNAYDATPDDIGLSMYVYYHGYVEIPLPDADRYWMHTVGWNELEVFTCDPGVISDAVAMRAEGSRWVDDHFEYTQSEVEINTPTSE